VDDVERSLPIQVVVTAKDGEPHAVVVEDGPRPRKASRTMKLSAIWILAMVIGQPQSNNIHHLRSGMRTRNRDMNHEILVGQKQDPDCSWLMKKTPKLHG